MANKQKGEVNLKVGDKEFTLRLSFLSLAKLEDLGVHLLRGIDESIGEASLVLKGLFVMTKGQEGVETLGDADELMLEDYNACIEAVNEAITLFFQKLEEKKAASQ